MSTSGPRSWAATGYLLGNAPPVGHHHVAADPQLVAYLAEELLNDTTRSWTMAAVRPTATPARRAAITTARPAMTWHQAGRTVSLPLLHAEADAFPATMGLNPPLDGWVFNTAVAEWTSMNDTELDARVCLLAGAR